MTIYRVVEMPRMGNDIIKDYTDFNYAVGRALSSVWQSYILEIDTDKGKIIEQYVINRNPGFNKENILPKL